MKERSSQVFIIEGTQGSGKTTATEHLSRIGCRTFRGIPVGQELIDNREVENWQQSMNIFELAVNNPSGSIAVMDRSIWSLVVYNIRMKPGCRSLIYGLGKRMFERRLSEKSNCAIVFLETDPQISFDREDEGGIHSHKSIEEIAEEAEVYQWLMENLERDGFNVIRISNNDIPKEEFLDLVGQTLKGATKRAT